MKRLLTAMTALLLVAIVHGQGIPFIRNFLAEEYHANKVNFDIQTDQYGNVFVANFEGVLYYDNAEWRIIHTPGITRVTVLYKAADNEIWVGGYNFFGKVVRKPNGVIDLQRVGSPNLFRGEVLEIYEKEGKLFFITDKTLYQVDDSKVSVKKDLGKDSLKIGMLDVVNVKALEKGDRDVVNSDTVLTVPLKDGMKAIVMKNAGIVIADSQNRTLQTITDVNGICSNDVSYADYDGHGLLWCATGKGIFAVQIPAAISHFSAKEGLGGAVLSIESLNGVVYAGTDEGLYRQEGQRFLKVSEVPHACWELKRCGDALLAASSEGIFRIHPNGKVRQLTSASSMALLVDGSFIYSGENDGIYLSQTDGQNRKRLCVMNKVKKIAKDKEGTIWAQSIYGGVWFKKVNDDRFKPYAEGERSMQTIVMTGDGATIVSAESTSPFPYPLMSYLDDKGVTWLTDNQGKNLYRWKNGKRLDDMNLLLYTVHDTPISCLLAQQDEFWLGNDDGITIINTKVQNPILKTAPKLYIRSVKLGGDSVLWGGFGDMPERLPSLAHDDNDLKFTFSLDHPDIAGKTVYRYRLNNRSWSAWSTSTSATFLNLTFGNYTFSVQARDAHNRITEIASISFRISPPFYYRWYMLLVYLFLLLALIYAFFRFRLHRLEKEKVRLEKIVKERTAEVVRLEKVATAGKLTQGLIDRILNPLNYINNFAKLSEGLVKDIKANVEDDRENMDEENYEDTMEVVDMLTVNLQKVSEHGQNTTRILKAMEELLTDRSGGISIFDIRDVVRQDEGMLHEFYKKEFEQYGIKAVFHIAADPLPVSGNAQLLSKTIMSLLSNAIHAVTKKAQKHSNLKQEYIPEITLDAEKMNNFVEIRIHDNGIGIEETILDKIFDPFFTTKSSSEAAGIGLYLSREILQSYGGDVVVKSVKDEFSEFIITLPEKNA